MERRRSRRYPLELPLSFCPKGSERAGFLGMTQNISSCGILFLSGNGPDSGDVIEYTITLTDSTESTNLRCVGEVIRSTPVHSTDSRLAGGYWVAATLERYDFAQGNFETSSIDWLSQFRSHSTRPRRAESTMRVFAAGR